MENFNQIVPKIYIVQRGDMFSRIEALDIEDAKAKAFDLCGGYPFVITEEES